MKRNINYASFTDEERAAVVVRYLAGEDAGKLAKEIGASSQVIEAWADKAAQAVGQKAKSSNPEADKELEQNIAAMQGEVKELQERIGKMRQYAEVREVALKTRLSRPIFSK
ncbi:MAG: hypothetical protein ACI38Q_04920 [Candidatus Bruticola sp.]